MAQFLSSTLWLILVVFFFSNESASAQKFIHPGIAQTSADMEFMKKQVLAGEQPWKDAFDRLKTATDLQFEIKPFTHVIRGPYGKPNIGGDELSKGANLAYNAALIGYITSDGAYLKKSIRILNGWSSVLWDFDYNDAKLLAGWTGHLLCNAAEILRFTDSGWKQNEIDLFRQMLMTVYYPLIRFYYPQANGNWDGAIIHSILAIAIFTDNREMFDNATDHFLHATVNGSIFKYIYPSGQCQESMRDQGHVQLGLGEFAGAARVAYTQGVDLFAIANNRLALGYEYTAQYLLGVTPQCYGKISDRAKNIRDDYEYIYRHYSSKGIDMPFTKMAADSMRPKATRSVLTAFRAPTGGKVSITGKLSPSMFAYPAGAMKSAVIKVPNEAVLVNPGQSIQDALNRITGKREWVIATAGLHKLPATLRIPSGVTLSGEGLATILFLDPASGVRDAIVNASDDLHDVSICDLVVEGAIDPDPGSDPNSRRSYRSTANRGGIIFLGQYEGQLKNICLRNVTVKNCTYNGVFISGASNLNVFGCDFTENGGTVVPGPKLQHNLLLTHCSEIEIRESRLDTSPNGCGICLSNCKNASVVGCELARNGWSGCLISESLNITVSGNLIEANDGSGILIQYLFNGSEKVSVSKNLIHYNSRYGVESYAGKKIKATDNIFAGNGTDQKSDVKISSQKYIIMQ